MPPKRKDKRTPAQIKKEQEESAKYFRRMAAMDMIDNESLIERDRRERLEKEKKERNKRQKRKNTGPALYGAKKGGKIMYGYKAGGKV